ncbi:hypothetical protein AX16_000153 [Volvariella volvacea WC 439]|nr:hypothetical protein AX16_000153 [Volvariella volvacea WC 439]
MSRRPPNELESKLHQAALATPKKELTAAQAESLVPDPQTRQDALNFLLKVGLFKSLVDARGGIIFRAVTKAELTATKDLSGEENLVLSHIKAAGNEGIWTKHLKAKTNLHQTVIDRCLKTLTQKSLIKRVPSVQHPTRKIYMLFNLEPSIALTGGPWYTDNELDTEFIQHLTDACLKFIRDLTFPKRRAGANDSALYALSNPPQYPTAQHIRNSLRQARITETDLSVEHVEMLLNVLVLDGEIEKLPAFGSSLWDSNAIHDEPSSEEEEGRSKKRKHAIGGVSDDEKAKRRKRKKKPALSEDSDHSPDEGSHRKKHSSRHKASKGSDGSSISDEDRSGKKNKKRKKRRRIESDSESDNSDEGESSSRKKKKRSRGKQISSSENEASESSESESFDEHRSRRRGKSRSKSRKQSLSPSRSDLFNLDIAGGHVYRAIRPERSSLGWTQAPCSICPSFEFCKEDGPVNPQDCVYYGDWLTGGTVTTTADEL